MPFETPVPLEDILNPLASYRAGERMANRGGDALLAAIRERTPVAQRDEIAGPTRKPGTARDSVVRDRVRPLRAAVPGWQVRVFTLDKTFQYIEWDTRPHLIVPKPPKQALHFTIGNEDIFATVVHHPGTKGQHPFARGSLFIEVTAEALLAPLAEEFVRELVTV